MARKRPPPVVEVSSSEDDDDSEFNYNPSDGSMSFDAESFRNSDMLSNPVIENCLREFKKIKRIEKNLVRSLRQETKRHLSVQNSPDAFTRFSVTTFSSVIGALTPQNKKVIERYGFESLLLFDECYVPNKFAKWVARSVDHKSGDIVIDGKVISFSKESVHLVTGLPVGGLPFPVDYHVGKSKVLSSFGKQAIPQVSFFADKIINHDPMSDEELVTCFLLVALCSFLCPNSSLNPCSKHFGIFENVENARQYDWCGYILQWLLDCIKSFNSGKTLGGCLYYMAVYYLDHVDFGSRQVPFGFPRISVWKQNMISMFSDLDKKSTGVFGFRPLLHHSSTCYNMRGNRLLSESSSLSLDTNFMDSLDTVSGCKLPSGLKNGICKLIEEHCLNSGLSFNMDTTAISSLPNDLKMTFSQLLTHVYSIDSRSKQLVLNVLKLVTEAAVADNDEESPVDSTTDPHQSVDVDHDHGNLNNDNCDNDGDGLRPSNSNLHEASYGQDRVPTNHNVGDTLHKDPVVPVNNTPSKSAMKNTDEPITPAYRKRNVFEVPPSGNQSNFGPHVIRKAQSSGCSQGTYVQKRNCVPASNPFCDITNGSSSRRPKSVSFASRERSGKDFISVGCENDYVPDSISPPRNYVPRYRSQESSQNSEDDSPLLTQKTPIYMQTLKSSQDSPPNVTPNLTQRARNVSTATLKSLSASRPAIRSKSPEVEIVGERTLSETVGQLSKDAEETYNSNLPKPAASRRTPSRSLSKAPAFTPDGPMVSGQQLGYKHDASTTGGKLPPHGPRRAVYPSRHLADCYEIQTPSFRVSQSEVLNYNSICELARSRHKNEFAVDIGGVKCSYWSLGESLMVNGSVLPYVVSAFCFYLFLKPSGHPQFSKKHYFFPSVSENLVKQPADRKHESLERAFKLSHKTRDLNKCDMLYFPTQFDGHWFIFVVAIKDQKWVFLDSFYKENDDFQVYVRDLLIPAFQAAWDEYIRVPMPFDRFDVIYPDVPTHSEDQMFESGICTMMNLEYWKSPRTILSTFYKLSDTANIRIKIANGLLDHPHNKGKKDIVRTYNEQENRARRI